MNDVRPLTIPSHRPFATLYWVTGRPDDQKGGGIGESVADVLFLEPSRPNLPTHPQVEVAADIPHWNIRTSLSGIVISAITLHRK